MVNKISLQVNGRNYTDLISYNIEKNIENLCGTFSIVASSTDVYGDNPIQPNDAIIIDIDGEPIITGYVDELSVNYSANSHAITVSGRDKTADFIDSTLDAKAFTPPIGFEDLLKKLLKLVGYEVVNQFKKIGLTRNSNQISVINNHGLISPFTTAEGIQLRQSESAFGLIKRCAEKRQLILNSDGDGNIVIRDIGDQRAITVLQNIKTSSPSLNAGASLQNNNIKNGTINHAWQDRFYQYTIKSKTTQGNAATSGVSLPLDAQVDPLSNNATIQSGIVYDLDVRKTRKFTAIGSSAMTSLDCKNRAAWEANLRITKGFSYSCEVFGFRQNLKEIANNSFAENPLWLPNQVVYVNDEFAGIFDELLIKSVRYSKDLNSGTIVKLELVDRLAYTRSIFEPLLRKKIDNEVTRQFLPGTE